VKSFRLLSPDFAPHAATISPTYGIMENGLSFQVSQDNSIISDVNTFNHFSKADNTDDPVRHMILLYTTIIL
jgi:hypothetical protein